MALRATYFQTNLLMDPVGIDINRTFVQFIIYSKVEKDSRHDAVQKVSAQQFVLMLQYYIMALLSISQVARKF